MYDVSLAWQQVVVYPSPLQPESARQSSGAPAHPCGAVVFPVRVVVASSVEAS
jgi:hypothetical protein